MKETSRKRGIEVAIGDDDEEKEDNFISYYVGAYTLGVNTDDPLSPQEEWDFLSLEFSNDMIRPTTIGVEDYDSDASACFSTEESSAVSTSFESSFVSGLTKSVSISPKTLGSVNCDAGEGAFLVVDESSFLDSTEESLAASDANASVSVELASSTYNTKPSTNNELEYPTIPSLSSAGPVSDWSENYPCAIQKNDLTLGPWAINYLSVMPESELFRNILESDNGLVLTESGSINPITVGLGICDDGGGAILVSKEESSSVSGGSSSAVAGLSSTSIGGSQSLAVVGDHSLGDGVGGAFTKTTGSDLSSACNGSALVISGSSSTTNNTKQTWKKVRIEIYCKRVASASSPYLCFGLRQQ